MLYPQSGSIQISHPFSVFKVLLLHSLQIRNSLLPEFPSSLAWTTFVNLPLSSMGLVSGGSTTPTSKKKRSITSANGEEIIKLPDGTLTTVYHYLKNSDVDIEEILTNPEFEEIVT